MNAEAMKSLDSISEVDNSLLPFESEGVQAPEEGFVSYTDGVEFNASDDVTGYDWTF